MAVQMRSVSSSNVEAIGFDFEKEELFVEFKNGTTYRYDGVPADVYRDFMKSDSKGKYLITAIKGVYPFNKV